ncbi:MAG: iron-containing redox enzyme family protein [Acidobacteriota bacterium]|nr:iron-containing redox enzyme family protein [Acidobacteriota bacterium]
MNAEDLRETLATCLSSMRVIPEIVAGTLSKEDLKQAVLNHYGETRSFIDVQLPARMYICPHDAMSAKRYFHYLYEEEQGFFGKEPNHALLFLPVCEDLGLTAHECEAYYAKYAQYYFHLFQKGPSLENLVEQLATSYAWESVTPFFGQNALAAFRDTYQFSERAMQYFERHFAVDDDHSKAAEAVLLEYCTTSALCEIALKAIRDTLGSDLYLVKRL